MHLTIPTMLTLFRIALVPVLVLFFYLPIQWSNMACVVIFVAGGTNGYRRWLYRAKNRADIPFRRFP